MNLALNLNERQAPAKSQQKAAPFDNNERQDRHADDRERYAAMSLEARKAHERKYNYETVFTPVLRRIEDLAAAPPRPQAPA